jgi:anaerobic magnesium-protoporphyrin IX monomethyl ester cyclase
LKQPKDFRVLIVYPNLTGMLVPSLAIGIFTRVLKDQGYQVELFDSTHYIADENSSPQNRVRFLQARKFDEKNDLGVRWRTDLLGDFRKKVEAFKPDFMILSVVEDCFMQAVSLLDTVKDLNIPHLMGGVFPTAAPTVAIAHPLVNAIGLGEGEEMVREASEAVRTGADFTKVAGTWHKIPGGGLVKNPRAALVDLDKYIPDFSLFDDSRFYRPMGGKIFKTIPVETYRGCPFTCTYCNSPMQNVLAKEEGLGVNYLRKKSVAELRRELRELVNRYDPKFFYFIDDSFTARQKEEVFAFCDMYEEFKIPFWFNTRPETTNPELLKRLKEVGAYRISFGIESGNEQFRKHVLKRNTDNVRLKGFFEQIIAAGIPFSVNLIIGFPGETRELVEDTVRFTKSIQGYDTVTCSIFTPYHGTVLREVAIKNGWLEKDYLTKHTTSSSALKMPAPYLNAQDIDGIMRTIALMCYFPESEWPALRRAEVDDAEGNRLLEHYSAIYKTEFLRETQEIKRFPLIDGASGCRSNEKDGFRVFVPPDRVEADKLGQLQVADREFIAQYH